MRCFLALWHLPLCHFSWDTNNKQVKLTVLVPPQNIYFGGCWSSTKVKMSQALLGVLLNLTSVGEGHHSCCWSWLCDWPLSILLIFSHYPGVLKGHVKILLTTSHTAWQRWPCEGWSSSVWPCFIYLVSEVDGDVQVEWVLKIFLNLRSAHIWSAWKAALRVCTCWWETTWKMSLDVVKQQK